MESLTLTVDEVARMLGINRMLAYKAVQSGEIPSLKIGRRVLVPKAAFAKLLESASHKPCDDKAA